MSAVSRSPELAIVHEDGDIVVIRKPVGLLAVPIKGARARNAKDLLSAQLARKGQKAIVVHRIDLYTSGLMVFAKHRAAHAHLVRQFLAHTPTRVYLTLVRGHPDPPEGELRHYLKLTAYGFRQVVVPGEKEGGTLAITRYRVLELMPRATLVEAQLVTGLKNQIRVQFAVSGMPIVGDRHYVASEKDTREINYQALHAFRLGFVHPRTERYVEFAAEPPKEFARLVEAYRRQKRASE